MKTLNDHFLILALLGLLLISCEGPKDLEDDLERLGNGILVFQSDFGISDGAVAAMKGSALSIAPDLKIHDLTHDIPAYDIWSAAHRLSQSAEYWPRGTVFVSVVDPGVGTDRQSAVLLTESGHVFVSPDNGSLSEVASILGVADIRLIDHSKFEADGLNTNTFHGRDVYARVGALIAGGDWKEMSAVGAVDEGGVKMLEFRAPTESDSDLSGFVEMLDVQYGNVWTNIPQSTMESKGVNLSQMLDLKISNAENEILSMSIPYVSTFGDVAPGDPLVYINSLGNVAFALNQDDFAKKYQIGFGPDWSVEVSTK